CPSIITYRDLTRHEKLIEFDKEKSPEVGLWWDMRFSNCQTTEGNSLRASMTFGMTFYKEQADLEKLTTLTDELMYYEKSMEGIGLLTYL
ncbi:hypothetical protein, partial [Xiamenia xianingshaonis]|uniref:hypothetical protein n=1 Tax=Xiamenia xianingshaonis TaxID=2682776 RepID=UPI0021BD023D